MAKEVIAYNQSSIFEKLRYANSQKNEDRLSIVSIYSLIYLTQNSYLQLTANASHTSSVMMMHGSLHY